VNYMEERDGWLGNCEINISMISITQILGIHYAARWGNNKMVKIYLAHGADVDGRTKNKETG